MENQSNHAGVVDAKESLRLKFRKPMLVWIEDMEYTNGMYKTIPPTEIVLYPDLMDRAWGWSRLVIYDEPDTIVEWPDFLQYLKDYFNRNAAYLFTISTAATYCLNAENKYRMIHAEDLSADDINLSNSIQERATTISNSEDKSVAAVAGLMCMAEEAKLMSSVSRDDLKGMSVFCGYIRSSALHLTYHQGSESDATAAALLGMWKETKSVRNLIVRGNTNISTEESECGYLRERLCPLLEKLENYFCCEDEYASLPSRDSDVVELKSDKSNIEGFKIEKSERLTRDSGVVELKSDESKVEGFKIEKSEKLTRNSGVVELKSDESNANEKSKDTDGHCGKDNHGIKKRKRSKNTSEVAGLQIMYFKGAMNQEGSLS